jgi:hypothetical protein
MAAFTQAMLDALELAIAQGAKRVKYSDKEVEYMSLKEMLTVRDIMRKALGLVSSTNQRIYLEHDKGTGGSGSSSSEGGC